jgi:hypothetical protein
MNWEKLLNDLAFYRQLAVGAHGDFFAVELSNSAPR